MSEVKSEPVSAALILSKVRANRKNVQDAIAQSTQQLESMLVQHNMQVDQMHQTLAEIDVMIEILEDRVTKESNPGT